MNVCYEYIVYYFYFCASAANEYNNGVVVSNRPLKDMELFEVRITDMIDKWTGSIEVGVTALRLDAMEMPATMTSIQSKTWVMSGSNIVYGGKTLKENYGISLDSLKVCVCVCVCLSVYISVCLCMCLSVSHASVCVCVTNLLTQ